jgi:RNA polymerase sigma-70 factor (ECF subfamily)
LTESELIKGCIKKKADCQRLLFDTYAGKMMSLCLRYVGDQEAKDILQIGFLKVFDYIHQYKGEGSFEGWMRRVFASVATRHLAKKRLDFTDIESIGNDVSYDGPGVIEKISEDEIHSLIRRLPDGYRAVFNLHVVEGYSHEEIAKMLHIQPTTSRTQLLKARKMLQGFIFKCCNTFFV